VTPTQTRQQRLIVGAALFSVYVLWGSTYLGLKFGLDGFPPFLLNGIRLSVAGGLLYWWARSKGAAAPTRRQWSSSTLIGGLMFVGGLGLVTIAEDVGVGSGLVAAGVAVMPLWAALWSGLFGLWPNRLEWTGLLVGFSGVALLSQEGDFQASALGTALMIIAPISWALGSVVSGRLDLPKGNMGSAAQMIGGGLLLLVAGVGRGEWIEAAPPLGAWLALAYLITAGSIVAYTAYQYLLTHTRPAVATSYAYVNPVVAIALGITLGDEIVGGWAFVGLPVILAGVGLVGLAQRR
jgi:drug/metabolite transporter (DMT)-like permease